MQDAVHPERIVRFGTFEVDPENEELRRNGLKVKLTGQPFQVLVILLEHPGRIVTREELQKRLWADTFVDFDHNLNTAINKIREVLGDSAETPRFVETLPRRGYRFIAPVVCPRPDETAVASSPVEAPIGRATETEPQESPTAIPRTHTHFSFLGFAAVGAVVIAGLIVAVLYLRRPLPPPHISEYVRLTLDGKHKTPVGASEDRLYLNVGDMPWGSSSNVYLSAGVVSLSGGEVTRIPFDFPSSGKCPGCGTYIAAVSPDGSKLLVAGNDDVSGSDLWIADSAGHTAQFLTRNVFSATWSPDGKQILYSNRHGDLFVIPSEGGESKLLLPSPAGPGEVLRTSGLSWSPDGTRIRFVRVYKYWEISSTGANLHRLLPGWDDATRVCCGRWSPDGDFFFFIAGFKITRGQTLFGGQIWALDERKDWFRPRVSKPIQLTEGPILWSAPIDSRDGKRIFSRQTLVRGELVRYDTVSKQYQPFLNGISAEFVDFSRDGKYVAYVSFPDGILWRANRDGTGIIQLTRPPYYPKGVRWSPDGTQLAFEDVAPGDVYAIYTVSSQGGTPVRLVPEDPRPQLDPTWSPDGKQVLYCTEPRFSRNPAATTVKPETVIFDLDSRKKVTLPPWKEGFVSPQWSPDGRSIVGVTYPSRSSLILFDLKSQQYRELWTSRIPDGINWNTWSHDGRSIYFMSRVLGPWSILRLSLAGGRPEMAVDLSEFQFTGWFYAWFGLDPQDFPLLLRDRGTQEIYALTLEKN